MNKFFSFFLVCVVIFLLNSSTAKAQGTFGGCSDSPENPTLVLAGLASGAFAVSQVKTRMRARRKSGKK
jgi:XrtJ-associated TM-motif-TM protein